MALMKREHVFSGSHCDSCDTHRASRFVQKHGHVHENVEEAEESKSMESLNLEIYVPVRGGRGEQGMASPV